MSIQQFLGDGHTLFRSTSPDIGYAKVVYQNNTFVAVGYQKGFGPGRYATEGNPVTCAGCSWSPDGVEWTDSRLPFAGTSTNYADVAYANGRWAACSNMQLTNGANRNNQAISTDNLATWTNSATRNNGISGGVVGGANKFFFYGMDTTAGAGNEVVGILQTGTGLGGTFVTEPAVVGGQPTQLFSAGCQRGAEDFFLFMTPERTKTFSAGAWTRYTNPAYGNWSGGTATLRQPFDVIYTPAGSPFGEGFWALIENVAPSSANRFARNIWSSGPLGGTWGLRATLPASGANNGGWINLATNGRIMVAIGFGAIAVSSNGVNWTQGFIPGGRWTSTATDGTDFVCVSADGDKLKISGAALESRM